MILYVALIFVCSGWVSSFAFDFVCLFVCGFFLGAGGGGGGE